jgi:hypothetical protein
MDSRSREQYCHPEGIGFAVAAGFWDRLETLEMPAGNIPKNQHYARGFYQMPRLRDHLGVKRRKWPATDGELVPLKGK